MVASFPAAWLAPCGGCPGAGGQGGGPGRGVSGRGGHAPPRPGAAGAACGGALRSRITTNGGDAAWVFKGGSMNRAIAAAVLLLIAALASATQLTRSTSSTSGGYYSPNQATRGKDLYGKNCSSCHLPTLKGDCPG